MPDTGSPGLVSGKGVERVLRSPVAGRVEWQREIGDLVKEGEIIGSAGGRPVAAPFDGVLRGLIMPGIEAPAGLKIGDLDPRADISACFTISDKALAVGGGVLEAIWTWMNSAPAPVSPPAIAWPSLSLPAAFNLAPSGEMVAMVGGGGKTSLMFALARAIPGPVVATTTTRIFAAQMKLAPAVVKWAESRDAAGMLAAHLARFGQCLVVGRVEGEKAAGVSPELPGSLLARKDVANVLIEADGSRRRPCKAPGAHEPVIPPETTLVVPVAGIDALDGPLSEVAHRPELAAELTGLDLDERLSPAALATLLTHPEGGLKGVPEGARVIPFINKVENHRRLAQARQVARLALGSPRIEQVVLGALRRGRQVREIHRRVTAVILAAGRSERMGQTKQLLPWGDTTVIGQTVRNLSRSAVHDITLVTGFEAPAVEAAAKEAWSQESEGAPAGSLAPGFQVIVNADFDRGEMLSSLKVALGQMPGGPGAVLVILADQPMVGPDIIDRLLVVYWQGQGQIVAPVHGGRRGNPVLISHLFTRELLALPPGSAPRALLQRYPQALYLVEVDDEAVLHDLDRPEDYHRWRPDGGGLTG